MRGYNLTGDTRQWEADRHLERGTESEETEIEGYNNEVAARCNHKT
jgi:hypothetical protein